MTFKDEIEILIAKNLKTYIDNNDRFIADYNREQELTKEYNGRQLLELLQNADDAKSTEVEIIWDEKKRNLSISNLGQPFSSGGIKSLMLANLSTKTKLSYIGNKGLGFRSILNWSENVTICTRNSRVSFSEDIAKRIFEDDLELDLADKQKIRKARNLSAKAIPFPVLAVPVIIEDHQPTNWATRIEIACRKEFVADINDQLGEITEEILLFLNYVRKITVVRTGKTAVILSSMKKKRRGFELVNIGAKEWRVFRREGLLPSDLQDGNKEEKQHFQLKVAYQEDLSDTYRKLFNFFPTQLSISLPCIVHGTFDLNSSRNHLNESNQNKHILKELTQLLLDCALFLAKEKVDWRPFRLLDPISPISDSSLILTFYADLEKIRNTEAIYPCINHSYHPLSDAIYYSESFNDFFQTHFSATFQNLLIPLDGQVPDRFKNDRYKHQNLVEQIDRLSESLSLELRADLITILAKTIPYRDGQAYFSLLINDQGKVIPKDELAFTPAIRADKEFRIPKSVKLDLMNAPLFDLLNTRFEALYDKREPRSRELQRQVKSVVNLQPYDSNNVIDKIIAGTKDVLKSARAEDRPQLIREMVAALFANFKNIENRQERLKISVTLIAKTGQPADSESLFLSQTYPTGEITEAVYGTTLRGKEYLADTVYWNLDEEESTLVESFFLWLRVNRLSKTEPIALLTRWNEPAYFDFIFKNGTSKPDDWDRGNVSRGSTFLKVIDIEQLLKLPVTRLVLLILKDEVIRQKLENNNERIEWFYSRQRPAISPAFSYIRYQFITSGLFTRYILEEGGEELNRLINDDLQIDYAFLDQFGINRAEVRSILIRLGAKESFDELLPEAIYSILRAIPGKDREQRGRSTQTIYKLALDSLEKQNSKFPAPSDIRFFAKKGTEEGYQPVEKVYYADNSILPRRILDTLPLLNLPKRSGEDQVEQYFGVKSLKVFKVEVNEATLKYHPCNDQLQQLFESIKPYILAYRLHSPNLKKKITDPDVRKREARTLKQCSLQLVRECFFSFGNGAESSIEEKEFINQRDRFFYRESFEATTDSLRKDSIFCDAFAEIMCIIFKVNDLKNDFRQVLKNELTDTVHLAMQDLGREKIDEAFRLLGVSRNEFDFWANIFRLAGKKSSPEILESPEVLRLMVLRGLSIRLGDSYNLVDFEHFGNKASFNLIRSLTKKLGLTVAQILPGGLYQWHRANFLDEIKTLEYRFKTLVWEKLNRTPQKQGEFIQTLNSYNQSFLNMIEGEITKNKYELQVNYHSIIRKLIVIHYHISIGNDFPPVPVIIQNLYPQLLKRFHIEEADLIDDKVRSLLFFEGNSDRITTYLDAYHALEDNEDGGNEGEHLTGDLFQANLAKSPRTPVSPSANGSNGSWLHSGKIDAGKKKKGRQAEALVYYTLVKEYGIGQVRWVSGNSTTPDKNDSLHYDIEYRNTEGEWKYVEVKAISDSQVIISNAEKDKGLAEPNKFEFALVEGDAIYMVKNLFDFPSGESFEANSRFVAYPKDYVFSFKVQLID